MAELVVPDVVIKVRANTKIFSGEHLYERGQELEVYSFAAFSDSTLNKGHAYGSMELISTDSDTMTLIVAAREAAAAAKAKTKKLVASKVPKKPEAE